MNTLQYILTYYGLYEHITISFNILRSLWTYYDLYEHTTICMNILRSIWTYYDLYEHTTIYMNIQRSVWLYYGSPSLWLYYDMYEHPTISMNNPLPELLLRPPFVTSASTDKSNCFLFERRILEVAAKLMKIHVRSNWDDCSVAKWPKLWLHCCQMTQAI